MDFGKLLDRGRKRHQIKSRKSEWGRCEQCDERAPLYPYYDDKQQVWMLCESCSDVLADEEQR